MTAVQPTPEWMTRAACAQVSASCGTRKGYWRHKDSGSVPCGACGDAERSYMRDYGQRKAS